MKNKQQMNNSSLRTILLLVFSLLCALLLWVYVTDTEGDDKPKTFNGVFVKFEGESSMRESRGLIVSDTSATSARVTLTGSRRTLSSLESADLTVTVDLSRITTTGYYSLAPQVSYPSRTDDSTISRAEISPSTISFYVDILARKTLPVEGMFSGSAAEGFAAEPLEINPGTVIIYGPEQVLANVDHAQVEVTRTEVDRTLTFDTTYTLIDTEGNTFEDDEITFDTETVNVTLPISAIKDVALIVDLISGGGATDRNVKWELDPPIITLTGDSEILAGVNNISVARIDLALVDETYSNTYRIVIPNDTEITSGATETTLTLELGGLYKRLVRVDKGSITCTNVSEGYRAEIVNDYLDHVILRGPDEEALGRISELNIRAVADLREYGTATGIVSVPVKISVDGSTDVGAVGEYQIYVNITEASGETEAGE